MFLRNLECYIHKNREAFYDTLHAIDRLGGPEDRFSFLLVDWFDEYEVHKQEMKVGINRISDLYDMMESWLKKYPQCIKDEHRPIIEALRNKLDIYNI